MLRYDVDQRQDMLFAQGERGSCTVIAFLKFNSPRTRVILDSFSKIGQRRTTSM